MKLIEFILKTEAPVILSESGGISFLAYTKDFIPGTVIRGLFANSYIKLKGLSTDSSHENTDFYNYFLSNKVSFGNAYIGTLDNQGNLIKGNYPLPLSLQHEKNDKNKIIDLLLETRAAMGIEQTKPFLGYGNIEHNNLSIEQVEKSFFFHHQRDRETGAPEENKFFNYEALAQGQIFKGDIRFEDDNLANNFWELFNNKQSQELIFYIGRSKNSQYGRVSLKLNPPADFNEKINLNGDSLILTFISDAILVNKRGHPCTDKDSIQDFLQEILRIGTFKIEKAFLRIKTIENYVSVWKLRRPTDLAIRAGSCLLIKLNSLIENLSNNDAFIKAFFLGLGERTSEGFGRFKINWQKGNISFNQPQTIRTSSPNINEIITLLKESGNGWAKNIAIEVIKNYLRRTTQAVAYGDATKIDEKSLGSTGKGPLARLEKAIYEFRTFHKLQDDFLNKSRPAFKESLKKLKAKNSHQNLFDTLINLTSEELIKKILPTQPDGDLNSFINTIESNLLDEIKNDLEYLYLKTFITALRHKQKILQKLTI